MGILGRGYCQRVALNEIQYLGLLGLARETVLLLLVIDNPGGGRRKHLAGLNWKSELHKEDIGFLAAFTAVEHIENAFVQAAHNNARNSLA
ncbi:hypothetical protein D3C81_1120400 [compost metagenome]